MKAKGVLPLIAGGRDHSAVRTLPQTSLRDVRHSVLRARQTQRALPGGQGPAAEETRHTRQGVGKGEHLFNV